MGVSHVRSLPDGAAPGSKVNTRGPWRGQAYGPRGWVALGSVGGEDGIGWFDGPAALGAASFCSHVLPGGRKVETHGQEALAVPMTPPLPRSRTLDVG